MRKEIRPRQLEDLKEPESVEYVGGLYNTTREEVLIILHDGYIPKLSDHVHLLKK